jgi:hypothetical protein
MEAPNAQHPSTDATESQEPPFAVRSSRVLRLPGPVPSRGALSHARDDSRTPHASCCG